MRKVGFLFYNFEKKKMTLANTTLGFGGDINTLEKLNDEVVKARLPAIIFQSILIVVGVTGNTCVWYIYGCKIRKQSTHKSLVLGIAFYDSLACCIGMPGNIVDLRKPLMFYNSSACKILRFGYHILAVGSTMTHLLMGFDRYRRICVSHGVQMSHKLVVYMIGLTFIFATIISAPTIAFYESIEVNTNVSGVSGMQCSQSESTKESILLLVYEILLGILVLTAITCLIVFYSMIGRRICNRETIINSRTNNSVRSIEPQISEPPISDETNEPRIQHRENIEDPKERDTSEEHAIQYSNRRKSSDGDVVNIVKEMQDRRASLRTAKSRRLTLITFILMLIFITSYCPIIILTVLYNTNPVMIDAMKFAEKCAYYVFLVSYTINNVSNPLVYLAVDNEFRTKLKESFAFCSK